MFECRAEKKMHAVVFFITFKKGMGKKVDFQLFLQQKENKPMVVGSEEEEECQICWL